MKVIGRRIDPGAIAVVQAATSLRKKRSQVFGILPAAYLNSIEPGQELELVADRAKIFPAGNRALQNVTHMREAAGDGLEVHIMLKQNARNMAKAAGILPHHQVFELQDVDRVRTDLAMDQPS